MVSKSNPGKATQEGPNRRFVIVDTVHSANNGVAATRDPVDENRLWLTVASHPEEFLTVSETGIILHCNDADYVIHKWGDRHSLAPDCVFP